MLLSFTIKVEKYFFNNLSAKGGHYGEKKDL